MNCPVCKAAHDSGPNCRRCRADLSPLFALEARRADLLAAAGRAAQRRQWADASALADEAAGIRPGPDVSRLRAVCSLGRRDFAGAWRHYLEARAAS